MLTTKIFLQISNGFNPLNKPLRYSQLQPINTLQQIQNHTIDKDRARYQFIAYLF